MMTEWARKLSRPIVEPLARALARGGVSANALTVAGVLLQGFAAAWLATGHLRVGGLTLAVAAACDGLDGAVARAAGRTTTFGAFLDSTMDRLAEIMIFAALLWFVNEPSSSAPCRSCAYDSMLVMAALSGSLVVSYTRARSEGLGVGTKAGWLGRLERVLILVIALLLGTLRLGLVLIAVGAWLTVAQRVWDVRQRCRPADLA